MVIQFVRSLIKHAAKMAEHHFALASRQHPLPHLLASLADIDEARLLSTAKAAWRCQLETWDNMLQGPGTLCGVTWWMEFTASAGFAEMPADIEQTVSILKQQFEAIFGTHDKRTLRILEVLAEYETEKADASYGQVVKDSRAKAIKMYELVLERRPPDIQSRSVEYNLAYLHGKCGRYGVAEVHMKKAMNIQRGMDGQAEDSPCMASLVAAWQEWLTEWGQSERIEE